MRSQLAEESLKDHMWYPGALASYSGSLLMWWQKKLLESLGMRLPGAQSLVYYSLALPPPPLQNPPPSNLLVFTFSPPPPH